MKVVSKWTGSDYDLLELTTKELVDGCFATYEDVKWYCKEYGYELVQ
jgi:hypothetical protein